MPRIEAPTDAQLLTIRHMCAERELPRPEVVFSKKEASEIISAISLGQYDPAFYTLGAGTYYGLDTDASDVPF
jgi:hypothetical protein